MKYLGLMLDSHWTFGDHFERLAPSVEATAITLGRLLPRPGAGGGGAGVGVRQLYVPLQSSDLGDRAQDG